LKLSDIHVAPAACGESPIFDLAAAEHQGTQLPS
jgi:hypothetical protein